MQAGGTSPYTDPGLSDTILEAPTFSLVLVFLFFLIVSVSFELAVEWMESFLDRRNRPGLKAALRKLVGELTLLGFVSLILMLFQANLSSICINYSPGLVKWTLLDNMSHQCLFNASNSAPYCDCVDPYAGLHEPDLSPQTLSENTCLPYEDNEGVFVASMFVYSATQLSKGLNISTAEVCELYEADALQIATLAELEEEEGRVPEENAGRRKLLKSSNAALLHGAGFSSGGGEHLLPTIKTFECQGPFLTGHCHDGQIPAISSESLTQLHLWIFLIAIFHVVSAMVMILLAEWRMHQWRIWQDGDLQRTHGQRRDVDVGVGPGIAALGSSEGKDDKEGAMPGPASLPRLSGTTEPQSEDEVLELRLGQRDRTPVHTLADAAERGGEDNPVRHSDTVPTPALPVEGPLPLSTSEASLSEALQKFLNTGRRQWKRRDTRLSDTSSWALEALYCVFHAFWPNMVTREEFLLIRASYTKTYEVHLPFDFVTLAKHCLEQDAARVVGISIEMWIVVILLVLISGLVGWLGSLFLVLAALSTLLTNIVLVGIVRYRCRGGRPNALGTRRRWYKGPWLVTAAIRMNVFLCSLIYSTTTFFAWQFGAKGCFFSKDSALFGFGTVLPWWTSIIFSTLLLGWLSWVTLPAFSLILNTSPEQSQLEAALPFLQPQDTMPGQAKRSISLLVARLDGERLARKQAEEALEKERVAIAAERRSFTAATEELRREVEARSPPPITP